MSREAQHESLSSFYHYTVGNRAKETLESFQPFGHYFRLKLHSLELDVVFFFFFFFFFLCVCVCVCVCV